jgi:hypothetical protein
VTTTDMPGPLPDDLYERVGALLEHPVLRANPELGVQITRLARAAWETGSAARATWETGSAARPADAITSVLDAFGATPQTRAKLGEAIGWTPAPPGPASPRPAGDPAKMFYRNIIHVTVLSRGPWDPADIENLSLVYHATDDGDCVGDVGSVLLNQRVTAPLMEELLAGAGSEPGFLLPDAGDPEVCSCGQTEDSPGFPLRCVNCGDRLPGTVADCTTCGEVIVVTADGRWCIPGEDPRTGELCGPAGHTPARSEGES